MLHGSLRRCTRERPAVADGYAEDHEDVLVAFGTVEAAKDQVIKERAEVAAKPTKRPRLKKSDVATGLQEAGGKTIVTGESSRPKRKNASAGGGQGSRGKKPEKEVDACSRDCPGQQPHGEDEAS